MFLIALGPSGTMWSFVEATRNAPGALSGPFSESSWAVSDACWPVLGPSRGMWGTLCEASGAVWERVWKPFGPSGSVGKIQS
eukprot:6804072-Pyramimonas_sp.AAC.1